MGEVTESTRTRVILEFTRLAPTNQGNLYATLGVHTSLGIYESSQVQIGVIVSKDPMVMSSTDVLSSDTTSITVYGTGFDATVATNNNIVFRQSEAVENSDAVSITGFVGQVSLTHLIFSFYTLGFKNAGIANVSLTVSNTYNSEIAQVATIVSRVPSVIPCEVEGVDGPCYVTSDDIMTIEGKGFFAGQNTSQCQAIYNTSHTYLDLSPSDSTQPDVSGTVVNCSRTRLVASWTSTPSACNSGFMTALVKIDDAESTQPENIVWLEASNFVAEVIVNEAFETYLSTTEAFQITGCGYEFTNLTFNASGLNQDSSNVTYSGIQESNQLTFDCVDLSDGVTPCTHNENYPIRGYVTDDSESENSRTILNIRFSMLSPNNAGILRIKVWNAKASDERGIVLETPTFINIGTVEAAPPTVCSRFRARWRSRAEHLSMKWCLNLIRTHLNKSTRIHSLTFELEHYKQQILRSNTGTCTYHNLVELGCIETHDSRLRFRCPTKCTWKCCYSIRQW